MNLFESIINALNAEAAKCVDAKRGSCIVDGCANDAFAKGMCNAHYIRSKKGKDLNKPIKSISKNCIECGEPKNSKGGWLRCAKHFKLARQKTIKQAAVNAMGGCCSNCREKFPLCVYDFHHTADKENNPSYLISNNSIEDIAKELEKCILLCANCHRIEHEK